VGEPTDEMSTRMQPAHVGGSAVRRLVAKVSMIVVFVIFCNEIDFRVRMLLQTILVCNHQLTHAFRNVYCELLSYLSV